MCPAGYELQDVSNQIDNTVFECKCQQHVPQIVLCESDQNTVVIEVHIKTLKYNPCNNHILAASGVHKSWVIQLPDHIKVLHSNEGFLDFVSPDSEIVQPIMKLNNLQK